MDKCPVCEFYTLRSRGQRLICPVCHWEDAVDYADDETPSGANDGVTVNQARKNFAEFGAMDKKHINDVRRPLEVERTIDFFI